MYRGVRKIKTLFFLPSVYLQSLGSSQESSPHFCQRKLSAKAASCLGFTVTSRINPIQRVFTQPINNNSFVNMCQAFETTFLKKFLFFYFLGIFAIFVHKEHSPFHRFLHLSLLNIIVRAHTHAMRIHTYAHTRTRVKKNGKSLFRNSLFYFSISSSKQRTLKSAVFSISAHSSSEKDS